MKYRRNFLAVVCIGSVMLYVFHFTVQRNIKSLYRITPGKLADNSNVNINDLAERNVVHDGKYEGSKLAREKNITTVVNRNRTDETVEDNTVIKVTEKQSVEKTEPKKPDTIESEGKDDVEVKKIKLDTTERNIAEKVEGLKSEEIETESKVRDTEEGSAIVKDDSKASETNRVEKVEPVKNENVDSETKETIEKNGKINDIKTEVKPVTNETITRQKDSVNGDAMASPPRERNQYLLPIQYYACGPNVQFNHFSAALRMALYQNRSIVEIPFATLGSQPHFDLSGLRNFNETFDVPQLHKIIDTVSIDTYKKECNNRVDAVLMAASKEHVELWRTKLQYEPHIDAFKKIFGIDIPKFSVEETSDVFYRDGLSPPVSEIKCLGLYSMYSFAHVNRRDDLTKAKVLKHLLREKKIRETALKAVSQICGGKPYVAIHWRNKTGETHSIHLPAYNENAVRIIPDILALMTRNQLGCAYAAHPDFSPAFPIILRDGKVPNVFDLKSVIHMNVSEDMKTFMQDKYMLSLVEQEICQHAALFLFTWQSNWSSFITRLRDQDGRPSIALEHLPSWKEMPK